MENTNKNNSLLRYIDKIIHDSCVTEERDEKHVSYHAAIIDNTALLFVLKCPWLRVTRRILYRLSNNLKKNFGLSLVDIIFDKTWGTWMKYPEDNPSVFYAVDHYAEIEHTIAMVKFENDLIRYFIQPSHNNPDPKFQKFFDAGYMANIQEKFLAAGKKPYYYADLSTALDRCRKDYREVFHRDMISVSVEILK